MRVLSQRVNLCYVSLIWMVMQREYTGGLSWFGRKKALRLAGGGEVLYFLAPKCLRRGYKLSEREPIPSLKERVERRLLKMLIFYGGVMTCFSLCPPFVESPAFPFIGSREGRDAGGCLRSEVLSSAVEAAVAMCSGNG
jgi:hypothetical protein